MNTLGQKREIWIDWLRVSACFMVMVVHSTEPFYLGGDGALILTKADAFWAALFDCIVRCCVPLFVVASSYLQFPLHYDAKTFFKKRALRVLVAFIIWSVFYAFWWGEPVSNLRDLIFNFNYAAGHLWFVYMLIGLYVIMPLLSPWAEKVSKKELKVYLGIWLFTTIIPILRDWLSGGSLVLTYGPTGIPRQALYPLWGEASWNNNGTFYYISGMIGYLLIGLYFRRFADEFSIKKAIRYGVPLTLAGFGICFGGFLRRVFAMGTFPAAGDLTVAVGWETTWCFDTFGVAIMTIGLIILFRAIKAEGSFYRKVLLPVSYASYGMYLMHMAFLAAYSGFFRNTLGLGTDGILGIWTTPVEIIATAVCSFITVAVVAVLVRRIPVIGKYIIG